MSDQKETIKLVHSELDEVRQTKKCSSCECLLDVLEAVTSDLKNINDPEIMAIRAEMESWHEEGNKKRHSCLGCEVCLPIKPYNRASLILSGDNKELQTAISGSHCSCSCDSCGITAVYKSAVPEKWPIVEGNYLVGNPSASVAVCTLADTDLSVELKKAGMLANIAIVGSLATENLGIERMIRNVVSNPNIRFLILCGRDSRGHHAGQAILSLKEHGIETNMRIVGAKGPRPVLKNIAMEEIEGFLKNITVIDEISTQDVSRLGEIIHECLIRPLNEALVLPPKFVQPKTVEAKSAGSRNWICDPEGFFLIMLDKESSIIVCEHYNEEGILNEVIRGNTAEDIVLTAIKRGLVSRLDHAAYLGSELAKAETALGLELSYIQDNPLSTNRC